MRKIMTILSIAIVLMLAACAQPSIEHLNLTLNPGIDTIEVGESHIDSGAKASYGLRFIDVEVIENDVDEETLGVYEIVYQANYSGITKTIVRIVTVIDETPPIINLNPGVDTIYIDETWVDAGISATDSSGGEISILVEGEVSNVEGEYVITYFATDESGNTSHVKRYVSVISPNGS